MASYAESGQDAKAAELAQSQLDANPTDPNALNNAVAVLMQAQKYPEAIQLLEKARANGTLNKESHFVNLAKLYLLAGQASDDDPAPNRSEEHTSEPQTLIRSSYAVFRLKKKPHT